MVFLLPNVRVVVTRVFHRMTAAVGGFRCGSSRIGRIDFITAPTNEETTTTPAVVVSKQISLSLSLSFSRSLILSLGLHPGERRPTVELDLRLRTPCPHPHSFVSPELVSLSLSISALLDFIFFLFFITRGSAHQRGQAKQSWPASKLPPRIRCLSFSYFEFSPFSLVFICSPSLLVALTEIYEVSLDLLVSNVLVPVLTGLI